MKRLILVFLLLIFFGIYFGCSSNNPNSPAAPALNTSPAHTPTSTESPTLTARNTAIYSPTLTLTATPLSTATHTSTNSPTYTYTSMETPSSTPTPSPTDSPTLSPTSSPTTTPTPTPTRTPLPSPTETATSTATSSPTATPTNSPTVTLTSTPTACLSTTSVGNGSGSSFFFAIANDVYLNKVTVGGTGTVQVSDVYFNINGGSLGSAHVGLYTDNGGAPQSLLADATVSYSLGWNSAPLPYLYLQAGNSYWVALSPYGTGTQPWAATSGSVLLYTGNASGLPAVLGVAPATALSPVSGYTMASLLRYCP